MNRSGTFIVGSIMIFQPFHLGTIDLTKDPGQLEIKSLEINGKDLIALHKIWLHRID